MTLAAKRIATPATIFHVVIVLSVRLRAVGRQDLDSQVFEAQVACTFSKYQNIHPSTQAQARADAHPLLLFINHLLITNSLTLYPFKSCATSVTSLSLPKGGGTSI